MRSNEVLFKYRLFICYRVFIYILYFNLYLVNRNINRDRNINKYIYNKL